jgi:hypothetical protein
MSSKKWVGFPNHNLQHIASEKPRDSPTTVWCVKPISISAWGCILMATSHSRHCWNTLYIYEADLMWVWSGRGSLIKPKNMIQERIVIGENLLLLLPSLWLWDQEHIKLGLHILMTPSHSGWCWNTIHMCMAKTCYVYEVGELSLHKLVQVQDSPTAATGLWDQASWGCTLSLSRRR